MRYGTRVRGWHSIVVCVALLLGIAGCRHKAVVPPLPQITEPVELVTSPVPDKPQMVEAPAINLPPVPTASVGGKIRRERKRRTQPANAATTAPAAPETPEAAPPAGDIGAIGAIGALSSGGDASPRAQQEAADLIAGNERRITQLPTQKVEAEKSQLSQVKNFQKQAQEALSTGDTEGAKTLATKAKLMLDDIDKL